MNRLKKARAVWRIGALSGRYPLPALAISFLLTAVFAVFAVSKMTQHNFLEMDVKALLPADTEVFSIYRRPFSDFFGYGFVTCLLRVKDTAPEVVQNNPGPFLHTVKDRVQFALNDQGYFKPTRLARDDSAPSPSTDSALISLLTIQEWTEVYDRLIYPPERAKVVEQIASRMEDDPSTETIALMREDPFGFRELLRDKVRIPSGPLYLNSTKGYELSEDGRMMLIYFRPVESATDILFIQDLREFLEDTRRGLYERNPQWRAAVEIDFTGPHVENAKGANDIRQDIVNSTAISLVFVLLLFVLTFRQPEALMFAAIPLIAGVIWTLGFTTIFIDRITQVTLTFAAILIGLGIDFSIHLYNRFQEGLRNDLSSEKALAAAIEHTGPSIVAGAITTLFAFIGLSLTRFVGFQELGVFGGVGIMMSLIAMWMILPAMMILFARYVRPKGSIPHRGMEQFLRDVTDTVQTRPRITVAAGLSIIAFFGFYAQTVTFNDDLTSNIEIPDDYRQLTQTIEEHFYRPTNQVFVVVEEDASGGDPAAIDRALYKNDRLYTVLKNAEESLNIQKIDSLREIIPSRQTQLDSMARFLDLPVEQLRTDFQILAEDYNIPLNFFEPFISELTQIQANVQLDFDEGNVPISIASFQSQDREIHWHYIRHDTRRDSYRVTTTVYPPTGEWREELPAEFRERVEVTAGIDPTPEIYGSTVFGAMLKSIIITDLALVVLVVLALVFVYLYIHFERRLLRALLAMIPLGFAILTMLGVMNLLGMKMSYLNVLAIPMIVGIGVDSAIHLLARYYENDGHNMKFAIERTGRAVVITSLTTIAGFGALSVANFQGIREIGILSIAGTVATLFASLLFLPSVLQLLDPRYTYSGGAGDDLG